MVETKPKTLFDLIREKLTEPKKVEEMKDKTGITKAPVVKEAEPTPEPQPISLSSWRPPYSPDKSKPQKIMEDNL